MDRSYIKHLAASIHDHWNLPAFSNYQGETYTYADFAARIEHVRLVLQASGIKPGDKVAIIGRNSAGWAMDIFSIFCYGCVAVPILHDFKPSSVHHILKHCEAKALMVANSVWENLDINEMQGLDLILRINDLFVLYSKHKKYESTFWAQELYKQAHPNPLTFEEVKFHKDQPEELALISYTSGTSGFSKGVMLPYRAIWGNMQFAKDHLKCLKPGTDVVSILPMAHMYGFAFEVYSEVCMGVHVHFLTRNPSPRIIGETFKKYAPVLIISVPMVLEKIVKKKIFPLLQTTRFKLLSHLPIVKDHLNNTIREQLMSSLGANFYEIIIGGAAFNPDVERFLNKIHFPYTVGYGMTECAPLITYSDYSTFVEGSVGRAIDRMEIRIDSPDPYSIVGEVQARGDNVMLGYYNNEAATKSVFTEDGWLRTGDLGTIDQNGNLFIRGRSKNMILGPSGQNIYPEEIEGQLNALPYISESLIVAREEKLVALIHPDLEMMDKNGVTSEQVSEMMKHYLEELNTEMPSYSRISSFQIFQDEFEKTPKRSIKRYLYH